MQHKGDKGVAQFVVSLQYLKETHKNNNSNDMFRHGF